MVGPDVAEAVRPAAGQQAVSVLNGPVRTWIHRTLESISDERILQKIVFRLAQAGLPHCVQIRHGPLEYGKDVVCVVHEGGRNVLRMYQMKCGDMTIPAWREVRSQLEEMFLAELPTTNILVDTSERVGVLVCTGHAQPHVEPLMDGWFKVQAHDHRRRFEFVHVDGIADWICSSRLVNEFRAVLTEVGISSGP